MAEMDLEAEMRGLPREDRADWPTVPQPEPTDPVKMPSHYNQSNIECIDALHAALGDEGLVDFCRGAAMKYLWRGPHKGLPAQDYAKAQAYLRFALNVMAGRKPREDA